MKIKIIIFLLLIIFILFSMLTNVFAANEKNELKIVKTESERKYLENEHGYIDNKIIGIESQKGETTMRLELNNSNLQTEKEVKENTEIYIIVSENIASQNEKILQYIAYIEELTNKIFEQNEKTKIGIIGIRGTIREKIVNADGSEGYGENNQGNVNGSEENAEIVAHLTDDVSALKNSIQNMNTSKTDYYINLQAAIRLASKSYTENTNKILISLYDTVPDIAIGVCRQTSYGGMFSQYATPEEAVRGKNREIVDKTKAEIISLKDQGIEFILLRPDDTDFDQQWYSDDTGELVLDFDGSEYVKELYGELEKPTYGKMYSLKNDSLDKIVTEYIYKDILLETGVTLKKAILKIYFLEEVLEKFDLIVPDEAVTYLEERYALWSVGDVKSGQNTVLEYKLKAKNMQEPELLDKVWNVNEKIELNYTNYMEKLTIVTVTDSPQIKIVQPKEELTAEVSYNPTTETTEKVTATIKTNKPINPVDGWNISEDGKILNKEFSSNTTETVHLVDLDGMTKEVIVKIQNIVEKEDETIIDKEIPNAGEGMVISIAIIFMTILLIGVYMKFKSYRDIN